ncbi:MAG: hypothetical protein NTZ37_02075, partial [Methanoregula sp.]|nr:hypothetical protein [Methanoregula sp.]
MSGPLVVFCIAQSDAKITFLRHQLDQREKLIKNMETSETSVSEDRIVALEKKVREMEALVKGLIQELLDLKSIAMMMSREAGECSRQEPELGPIVQDPASPVLADPSTAVSAAAPSDSSTVIRPRDACQPDVPAATAEPAMARIMQSDGTMKLEVRCGDRNQIDSSTGYKPTRMAHLSRATRSL